MKTSLPLFALVAASCLFAQPSTGRWSATTGDVSLSGAGTTATLQQPATNAVADALLDQVVVYCSVACTVTQAANGSAASTTAGTVIPILPTTLSAASPLNFYTASNVGTGTAQGGAVHVQGGSTVTMCLSISCGNAGNVMLGRGLPSANYSVTIGSITGTANVTFIFRTIQ